jgi:hypothetical protein
MKVLKKTICLLFCTVWWRLFYICCKLFFEKVWQRRVCIARKNSKQIVEKYRLNGINLFAEGNKIRQLYNVQGIPHYVLINKKGEFEERNSLRPSQILHASKSKFDQLANEYIKESGK